MDSIKLARNWKIEIVYDTSLKDLVVPIVTVREKIKKDWIVQFIGPMRCFLFWLFRNRCVICKRPATEINHILPKSRGEQYEHWKNQVTTCQECHNQYHQNGVTDDTVSIWQAKRKEFLTALGRKVFI